MHLATGNTETAFLSLKFSGMPVADGSFGWRWLSTESAGVGEKRLWLTGLSVSASSPGKYAELAESPLYQSEL